VIAVDTNILIYAHRRESGRHVQALAQLTALAEGDSPWGLPVFCIAEFVRVVTHLRVFTPPSDLRTALDFIDRLLESPSSRLLLPGESYPTTFRGVCQSAEVRGNLAFDAQIAATCLEHGVHELITADRDFARFTSVSPRFI
jgi:toxin-antitoxin system PIN domain toxin